MAPAPYFTPTPTTMPQGKEDCVRKAQRGVDIAADLMRTCPALSLPQVSCMRCPGSFTHTCMVAC